MIREQEGLLIRRDQGVFLPKISSKLKKKTNYLRVSGTYQMRKIIKNHSFFKHCWSVGFCSTEGT